MLLKIRSVDKRCKLLPDKHEATFVFVKNKMMYKEDPETQTHLHVCREIMFDIFFSTYGEK